MTSVRAIAVGIPERLKDTLTTLDGVIVLLDLVTAAGVLEDHPHAVVLYGEALFGMAVTGQPVFLLDGQGDVTDRRLPAMPRVWVVIDISLNDLTKLDFDDPRLLAVQAALRLRAARIVDLSAPDILGRVDGLLNDTIDTPRDGGYPEATGNDENGDPNATDPTQP